MLLCVINDDDVSVCLFFILGNFFSVFSSFHLKELVLRKIERICGLSSVIKSLF